MPREGTELAAQQKEMLEAEGIPEETNEGLNSSEELGESGSSDEDNGD
jgi:hypothetical protein